MRSLDLLLTVRVFVEEAYGRQRQIMDWWKESIIQITWHSASGRVQWLVDRRTILKATLQRARKQGVVSTFTEKKTPTVDQETELQERERWPPARVRMGRHQSEPR